MAGIEFFPKVDRMAGLEKPQNSNSASTAKNAAKKGASAPGDSFADVLNTSSDKSEKSERPEKYDRVEKSSSRPVLGRDNRKSTTDRLKEDPTSKTDVRDSEQVAARQPVRDVATEVQKRVTSTDNTIEQIDQAPVQEKSALKEKAVIEFMGEMEEQFGVSPEQIVEAFSNLDEDALNGKPEDAMNQFLANLQIPPQQMPDARKLYMKMVSETGDSMLNEKLIAGQGSVNFDVMSPKEMKRLELQRSLDEMTNRFFPTKPMGNARLNMFADPMAGNVPMMDPNANAMAQGDLAGLQTMKEANQASSVEGAQSTEQASSANGSEKKDSRSTLFGAGALGAGLAGMKMAADSAGQATKTSSATSSAMTAAAANPLAQNASGLEQMTDGEQSFDGESSEAPTEQQLLKNLENAAKGLQGLAPSTFAAAAAAVATKSYGSAAASESRGNEKEVAQTVDPAALTTAGLAHSQQTNDPKLDPQGMILQQPQATAAEKQENINELIKNAQVILKKGGGEMNMQLRPEGLGSVKLKVMVQDGQVNVQMITENDSAKKLLENGISDLKHQLAANKLHIETMKVESAGDAAMQKFEQSFNDHQREQQRQMASDFLGSFRDDRQSFMGGFMDRPMMGGNGYKQNQKRRDIEPTESSAEIAAASSSKNGRRTDGARRLNLVA